MSGGTDICSAFVAGSADLPVYAGEIQCACLGVDVAVLDDAGEGLPAGDDGELVIRQPIPSMPLCFWADEQGLRYRESYFTEYAGLWRHGDLIRLTEQGGYVISGRSDATLNRFGVRIGTAEIYRAIESLDEVKDSLIVSLELPGARFFMPLFVVLQDRIELTDSLVERIAATLASSARRGMCRTRCITIEEVPYTLTGKKLGGAGEEAAARCCRRQGAQQCRNSQSAGDELLHRHGREPPELEWEQLFCMSMLTEAYSRCSRKDKT